MSDELKQRASIGDDPEFRALAEKWQFCLTMDIQAVYAELVAHIDAWGASMAVPAGYRVVPNDSTDEMNLAGCDMLRSCGNDLATTGDACLCWAAMMGAASARSE